MNYIKTIRKKGNIDKIGIHLTDEAKKELEELQNQKLKVIRELEDYCQIEKYNYIDIEHEEETTSEISLDMAIAYQANMIMRHIYILHSDNTILSEDGIKEHYYHKDIHTFYMKLCVLKYVVNICFSQYTELYQMLVACEKTISNQLSFYEKLRVNLIEREWKKRKR